MARILLFALTAVFTWPSPAPRSGRRYSSTRIQGNGTAKGIDIGQIIQEGTTSVARRLAERAVTIQTSTGSVRVLPSLRTAQSTRTVNVKEDI